MNERQVRLPVAPSDTDRRAGTRYPLSLDLRYAVLQRRKVQRTGNGRLVDMSSSGLRFTADGGPLDPGLEIELSILWPVALAGGVELQLKAYGTIVWTGGSEIALRLRRHEFRTLRRATPAR